MTTDPDHASDSNSFSDWLDSDLVGMSTPTEPNDADLSALRATVHQIHGMDEQLTTYAISVQPHASSWEDILSTNFAVSPVGGRAALTPRFNRTRYPQSTSVPRFQQAATMFLVAAVVLAVTLGFGRYAGNLGGGGPSDPVGTSIPFAGIGAPGGDSSNSLAPMATPGPNDMSSSFPYPTRDECVVTPMTRDEVVQHLEEANVAKSPRLPLYEQQIEPTDADALAIMQVFRGWQACGGERYAQQMKFESPWFTAKLSGLFLMFGRPASVDEIQDWADIAIVEDGFSLAYGTPATENDEPAFTLTRSSTRLPLPVGATPTEYGGSSLQTIFADDIEMLGPDYARALATWVDQETGEVQLTPQIMYEFVRVDGKWLLSKYDEDYTQGRG